ncbi:rolling circle replication-associated protein [Methanococcus voltae]|uniref:rolling circle replication-associated protein n=1 Tax=Methanococcus voltae TaxID=2188 RepID=UPI0012F691EE|nr:hypothetical protein [Methanococcus voltae]MCS3901046.1 hypothetical protein [Methanococcus voltae]
MVKISNGGYVSSLELKRINDIILSQLTNEFTIKDIVNMYSNKYDDCNNNAIAQKTRRLLNNHIESGVFTVRNALKNKKIYKFKDVFVPASAGDTNTSLLFYSTSMKNSNHIEKQKKNNNKYNTNVNKPTITPDQIRVMAGIVNNPQIKSLKKERFKSILHLNCKHMLNEEDRTELLENFKEYIIKASSQNLVLERTRYHKNKPKYITFPYLTRFTNSKQLKRQLAQYNCIFEQKAIKYNRGVHLTLTTDPKLFRNIYEANKHFSKAFNRFMSFLSKRNKDVNGKSRRPVYLAAYEYTKSGLCHAHILIFGKKYLLDQRVITQEWSRCGQGQIAHIYSIRRDGINWIYGRARPEEIQTGEYKNANEYLKKYLVKSLYSELDGSMYWAMNKRFFTFSKSLKPAMMKRPKPEKYYKFVGIWTDEEFTDEINQAFKTGIPYDEIKKIHWKNLNNGLSCG